MQKVLEEGHHQPRRGRVQRRRLHRRVADRGGRARARDKLAGTTLDVLPELVSEDSMVFQPLRRVQPPRECTAATTSRCEQYALSIGVEAWITLKMANHEHPARGHVLPDRARVERRVVEGKLGVDRRHRRARRGVGDDHRVRSGHLPRCAACLGPRWRGHSAEQEAQSTPATVCSRR